ncbi:MAG TPA: NUDIX domain-containing protein [Aggregatilineales bacterium]|nr:NUDIX domain-containing protein [Aggregatilineales bacterium]
MSISDYLFKLRQKIGHDRVMMPGVTGIVINAAGEILLQRSVDTGQWYLPGGAMDPGEEPADTVVREIWEETGVRAVPEQITGVYAEPLVTYPNGDQVLYTCIAFRCQPIGGQARVNDEESLEVRYFAVPDLPDLTDQDRLRIRHARSPEPRTFFLMSGRQG